MPEQLQKAISLAKKTGDKIMVFDSSMPDDVFVIMGLSEYEKMVDAKGEISSLTEDELLDRINRDVAIWKSENSQNEDSFFDLEDKEEEDEDMYYYEAEKPYGELREPDNEPEASENKEEPKNQWKIPPVVKEAADEVY